MIKSDGNNLRIINLDLTSVIKKVTCLADNRKQTSNYETRGSFHKFTGTISLCRLQIILIKGRNLDQRDKAVTIVRGQALF